MDWKRSDRVQNELAMMRVKVMLQMGWCDRHVFYRKLAAMQGNKGVATRILALMSPADMLDGINSGAAPDSIIPLPDKPRVRWTQLKLTSFFNKKNNSVKKDPYKQLRLHQFFKTKHR